VNRANKYLLVGGVLSGIAALLHIGIIIGGPEWYRFFGAGEELASMSEDGSFYPAIITFGIALVLFVWALYAFSGAGLIRRLPFLKLALILIAVIYLARGVAIVPAYFIVPELIDGFLVWSSLICLIFGISYALGTKQAWFRLSAK